VGETLKFFDFLSCIDDVDKALGLYAAAGISITESAAELPGGGWRGKLEPWWSG
jgi:hypothetical protein